jgi:hypothetical protein
VVREFAFGPGEAVYGQLLRRAQLLRLGRSSWWKSIEYQGADCAVRDVNILDQRLERVRGWRHAAPCLSSRTATGERLPC